MSVPQRRVPAVPSGTRSLRRTLTSRRNRRSASALVTVAGGPHPVELAGLLHELTVRLLSADTLPRALDRLTALAVGSLPGAVRCSVALIGEGGPLMEATSGSAGETFDRQQYEVSLGPGLEAARTRSLVTAADLCEDDRWPQLREAAAASGVRAVAAVPLDVRRTAVGALSVYLANPGEPAPELLVTAMALAGQAEVLLGELGRRAALTEGAEVDRAVGVIIAQRGCGVQEAYAVLQESAQRLGLDRRVVAERLVAAAARKSSS
ncbi:GAF and ANTAR domain-containing protein [Actinoplanes missouriensis]|uniref:GAF and ANTAR domain-containing protein n=1 Tax=Actinoplanes missouriensis TaxID=1866 RepID=UPI000312F5F9|nr:GAF and ANTAR domain-containing protein [Actinoplanes missouriensis]